MAKLTSGNTQQHRGVKSCDCEYNNHLEMQHGVIFSEKDNQNTDKSKSNREPDHGHEKTETEITRTDADTVKELVEMKFLPKKRK